MPESGRRPVEPAPAEGRGGGGAEEGWMLMPLDGCGEDEVAPPPESGRSSVREDGKPLQLPIVHDGECGRRRSLCCPRRVNIGNNIYLRGFV